MSKKIMLILSVILGIASGASYDINDTFTFAALFFIFTLVFLSEYRYALKKIEDDEYWEFSTSAFRSFFGKDINGLKRFAEKAAELCFVTACVLFLKALLSFGISFIK